MKISIIGTGVFGLAIACSLVKNNNNVLMWAESEETINKVKSKEFAKNNFRLPKIDFTTSLENALENSNIIFVVVALKYLNNTFKEMKKYLNDKHIICIASKGIDFTTTLFPHEIALKYVNKDNICVISGPTFAIDLANNNPIAFSIAGSLKSCNIVSKIMVSDLVKVRKTKDILGIEICGAVKNVIAIASGIITGLSYTESTRAFLITEAMHDIKNLIKKLGGNKKTINSYAGIGDLILTATSLKSRNYTFGTIIAKNDKSKIDNFLKSNTVEGYYSVNSIIKLFKKKNIDAPIIKLIYDIINYKKEPNELIKFLINKK